MWLRDLTLYGIESVVDDWAYTDFECFYVVKLQYTGITFPVAWTLYRNP